MYILFIWLNMYWEDFYEPSEFPCLTLMVVYLNLHMSGSEEQCLVQHLLFQWEFLEPNETDYEGEKPGFECQEHEESYV
jgi:ral guanine nucleotide dissociation stimulator